MTSCWALILSHCLVFEVSVHTFLNHQESPLTPYWIYLIHLTSFEFEKSPLVSCVLIIWYTVIFFIKHNCRGVCCRPICTTSCIKSLQSCYHMPGWCVRELSLPRPHPLQMPARQHWYKPGSQSNDRWDRALYCLPSHFIFLATIFPSPSSRPTLLFPPNSLCWAWKSSVSISQNT